MRTKAMLILIGIAALAATAQAGEEVNPLSIGATKPTAPAVALDAASISNALTSPSKQVRYHAAAALAKIGTKMPYQNCERVIPLLSQALSERGARVALVAARNVPLVNVLKEALKQKGYIVDIATTENAAINVGLSAPLKDVIIIEATMKTAFKVFSRDYRTAGRAKVLIAGEGNIPSLRDGLGDLVAGFISTPADANSVEAALIDVLKDLPAPPAKTLAAKFNLLAAQALANTCPKRYPLASATPALINALKLPDSVKLPSMKALARIGAAEATPALILLAGDSAASARARIAAIETIDAIARKAGALDAKAKEQLDRLMLDANIDIGRAAAIVLGANDPVDSALKRLLANPKTIVDETVGR